MMENRYEQAKKVLECILDREWNFRGDAPDELFRQFKKRYPQDSDEELRELIDFSGSRYFLRKGIPEIIAKGNHQVVLSLGNGYVGKTRVKIETSAHYASSTLFVYEPGLVETIKVLRELHFDVPEHHYVELEQTPEGFKVSDDGLSFVIAADLTENRKYLIEEVNEPHFESLINGAELKQQLIDASRTLQEVYDHKNPLYRITVNDHVTGEGPQEAFRRMFFTQIDHVTNKGKLVLGDLDHVFLFRNP